jgi:hypothetical protein
MVRQVQQAEAHFWKRWRTSYLQELSVDRVLGGRLGATDLRDGDPILIKDSSNPLVEKWVTGKVVRTLPSTDGFIRSALVKTDVGEKVYDIQRLAIIEGAALERKKPIPHPASASGGVSAP